MAETKCGKCGGKNFELKIVEPADSRYKQNFIQCAKCGMPVGVLDYYNTGAQVDTVKQQIAALQTGLNDIGARLKEIETALREKS